MVFAQIFTGVQNGKSFNLSELRKQRTVETKVKNCRNAIHKVTTISCLLTTAQASLNALVAPKRVLVVNGLRWSMGNVA